MSQMQFVSDVMVAATIGVSLHSLSEPFNIRIQVAALKARLAGEEFDGQIKLPFALDKPWKALLTGFTIILVTGLIAYFVVSQFTLQPITAMGIVIVVLLMKELANTLHIDRYHVEIGSVIDSIKK